MKKQLKQLNLSMNTVKNMITANTASSASAMFAF